MRSFIKNQRGFAAVTIIAIVLIISTAIAWVVTTPFVGQLIEIIDPLTDSTDADRIFTLANNVLTWLLIGEVAAVLVWWGASAFRREDQTYPRGSYGY